MREPVTLYHWWRSSSSWRVRWALALKQIKTEYKLIDLTDDSSEKPEHIRRSPLGYVPVLDTGDHMLVESVAIIEWLEEMNPSPALYPGDAYQRAHIRSLVEIINSSTQPLQNPTVAEKYSADENKRKEWVQFFIRRGLAAYQTLAQKKSGRFSVGDHVTAADLFLLPQLYGGQRFGITSSEFPLLAKIEAEALKTHEAAATHPDKFKP